MPGRSLSSLVVLVLVLVLVSSVASGKRKGASSSASASSSSTGGSATTGSFGRRVVAATARGVQMAGRAVEAAVHHEGPPEEEPEVVDVAIVGGGIGGLATALAFKRLTNLTARVFERSPTLRGGEGTALTMWPNGLSALGAIDPGLLKRVKAAGSVIRRQTFTTPQDSVTEDTGVFEGKFGEPLLSVFWKTLHNQLADAVGREAIALGKNCVGVEMLPDDEESEAANKGRVLLTFEDGSEVRANCVLAADGVHSVLRQRFVGDGKPREHGRFIYRCVIPHHACPLADRDQMLGKINADPSKLIHWQPCGAGNTYWAVIKRPTPEAPLVRRDKDPEAMKRWLLEEYADFPEILPFIAATPARDILERPVIDRAPIQTWGFLDGRVLLIGDAAHAMILSVGQGANTALEDAVYIATYLRDALKLFPDPTAKGQAIQAAFRAFQDVRVPHCTAIQTESETYAKNAYGAPQGAGGKVTHTSPSSGYEQTDAPSASASTMEEDGEGEESESEAQDRRKLGGYRLVKFQLIPFEDAYFQHAAAAKAASCDAYAPDGEERVRSTGGGSGAAAGKHGGKHGAKHSASASSSSRKE